MNLVHKKCVAGMTFALIALISGLTSAQPATQPARGQARGGPMPANPALRTLWLVGDSTMSNNANGGLGWSTPFIPMFDPGRINVVNRGIGGRSSRSFQVEGRWDSVLNAAKPGDFVIVQMGHNDGGDVTNPNGRPSLKGTGEETQEITKANGATEVVHTYGWYMRKYITDAKAKGLSIIICSSVPHWQKETVAEGATETRFVQVAWAEEVAKSQNVPFVNVNKVVMAHYAGKDPQEIRTKYFTPPGDGTHTNPDGAKFHAECVVEGLKQLKDPDVAKYLKQ